MTPDNSTRRSAGIARNRSPTRRFTTGTVLVADGDPDVTDDIARALRDRYAIRTAYSGSDALASFDADVTVALLDPALLDLRPRRIANRTDGCQLAALVDADADAERVSAPFDEYLRKPVAESVLRETVATLCRRANYRRRLDEYYETATALADADGEDHERLTARLDDIRSELDAVLDGLDREAAFEAALGDRDG